MKPRVVFLLQVTALCGIFTFDFSKGYDSGRNYVDSIWTSFVVLLGGTMASGGSMAGSRSIVAVHITIFNTLESSVWANFPSWRNTGFSAG